MANDKSNFWKKIDSSIREEGRKGGMAGENKKAKSTSVKRNKRVKKGAVNRNKV